MTKPYRRWGYSKDDAKIFEIPKTEPLPDGYYSSPALIPADEPKKPDPKKKPAKQVEASEEE